MKLTLVTTANRIVLLAMLATLAFSTPTPAAERGGATLSDTLTAGGKTLQLNGLGLRKKAMFKVYVGGLYLESHAKDAGASLRALARPNTAH